MKTLPPDPEGMNNDRAIWADAAIRTFAAKTNMDTAGEDDDTILGDLLGSLRHWCDRHGVDFDTCAARGAEYYFFETGGQ